MPILARLLELADRLSPPATASAHCDLPCGVYDPAQARIEADSVQKIIEKYHASSDEAFKARCIVIKEARADLAKHHLWVLWTDYFKPEHLEQYPDLHDLFWKATKAAGQCKQTTDP
ncbi:MAG TPA: superoxide dismutase, Ni, partial [Acidimicrobiales bacterium]|nr:superoxide dismutase, Ni [Acidimicrobiales bacterium]